MVGFHLHFSIFAVYAEKVKHPSVQTSKLPLPENTMPGILGATTIIEYAILTDRRGYGGDKKATLLF